MGADIHMYVQYGTKGTNYWSGFGGQINPGRNYAMFGILAGVRREFPESFDPKGLPDHELSYQCNGDLYLYISKTGEESGHTTLEKALEWNKNFRCKLVNDREGKPIKVQHPDWHSHSWMTVKELSKAYRTYFKLIKKEYGTGSVPAEYKAILDVMKSLEKNGDYIAEVVFWFDN